MTLRIDFDDDAILEIRRVRLRYKRIRDSLANRFMSAVVVASDKATAAPRSCSPHLNGTRIIPVRKFPYWVVFIEEPHRIFILAVMHSHRRPGYWRRRLPKP